MSDFFAYIYEVLFDIFNHDFHLIFSTLFNDGGYLLLGGTFIVVPLMIFSFFYFLLRNPYATIWYWVGALVISTLITVVITLAIAYSQILAPQNIDLLDALRDPNSGYEDYANTLPAKYSATNALLGLIIGFGFSLIIKRFSKVQMHLPF